MFTKTLMEKRTAGGQREDTNQSLSIKNVRSNKRGKEISESKKIKTETPTRDNLNKPFQTRMPDDLRKIASKIGEAK